MNEIKNAVKVILSGGLIVYPTDTLYALGCNALNEKAILKVYKAKERSLSKPLPIAVESIDMMKLYAYVDERAEKIARKFLPGALTLVLKKREALPDVLTSGLDKVAIRIPAHYLALKSTKLADVPIVATSANISGEPPPASVEEIKINADCIINGGKLEGTPSTIIDLTEKFPKILRRGKIDGRRILDLL